MLYLISLGLHDEKDISLKGVEAARKCDTLFLELYTDPISVDKLNLERILGKKINTIGRKYLEEASEAIISLAKRKNVGIIVGGDCLAATTHIALMEEARRLSVKTRLIHGSSIVTAVGETGLMVYKFGRITTLTDPVQKSVLDAIFGNKKMGLHTLVLLDIDLDGRRALDLIGKKFKEENIVIACDLGGRPEIKYGKPERLLKAKFRGRPAVLIIPGKLHFTEREYLDHFSV